MTTEYFILRRSSEDICQAGDSKNFTLEQFKSVKLS